MVVALSQRTIDRVAKLYALADQGYVEDLLAEECGANLPGLHDADSVRLERVRFAVLKVAGGDLAKLLDAIALAQQDWRDVLMAAGFGHDVNAHLMWSP